MRKFILLCLQLAILIRPLQAVANPYLNSNNFSKCHPENAQMSTAGNSLATIPELPRFTIGRLLAYEGINLINDSPDARTEKIITLGKKRLPEIMLALKKAGIILEINKVAAIYNVDPVQIAAPIIAEKIFNGELETALQDHLQNLNSDDFIKIGNNLKQISDDKNIQDCMKSTISNYWKWRCMAFYSQDTHGNLLTIQVKKASTCGIAQFNPVLIWSLNDIVVKKSGLEKINFADINKSMQTVLNPKEIIHYLGAYSKMVSELYQDIACFDIRKNAGLVATLYNVGNEYERAFLKKTSQQAPQVNYFGWFINYFEKDIRESLKN